MILGKRNVYQVRGQLHDQRVKGPAEEKLGKYVRQDGFVREDGAPWNFSTAFSYLFLAPLLLHVTLNVVGIHTPLPDVLHLVD